MSNLCKEGRILQRIWAAHQVYWDGYIFIIWIARRLTSCDGLVRIALRKWKGEVILICRMGGKRAGVIGYGSINQPDARVGVVDLLHIEFMRVEIDGGDIVFA